MLITAASAAELEMQGHAAEPSRRGKRKSDSVDRNPAQLLAQARAMQVCSGWPSLEINSTAQCCRCSLT